MNIFPLQQTALEREMHHIPIDLPRFWIALDELERHDRQHGRAKHNVYQAVRLRYFDNGSIAHTYREIGAFYGTSSAHAADIVHRGLARMRREQVVLCYRRA